MPTPMRITSWRVYPKGIWGGCTGTGVRGGERERRAAICTFCDTDFVGVDGPGGGRFATADDLADHVAAFWPGGGAPLVVCTGGEPALQLDDALVAALHERGLEVAIETNGTLDLPAGIDWVCVSPKGAAALRVVGGDELKLVYPQAEREADPARFAALDFAHRFLQPLDTGEGAGTKRNAAAAVEYCLRHPEWRLSVQVHKVVGIE